MGFKTTNYESKALGLTVPKAYAKVMSVNINEDGFAYASFYIQQEREDIGNKAPLGIEHFNCKIDKELPIYSQIYKAAKGQLFIDWEDDIVED